MPEDGIDDGSDAQPETTGSPSEDREATTPLARRDVLRTAGAVGVGSLAMGAGTAAGQEEASEADYVADPVALDETFAGERPLLAGEPILDETAEGVAYESALVAYGGDFPRYGMFATPDLTVDGHEPSRPGSVGPGEFLHTEAGHWLLEALDVAEGVEWTRGPERFEEGSDEYEHEVLGEDAATSAVFGVLGERRGVLAVVSRVEYEGDVVFSVSVRSRELESGDQRVLSGDDDGVYHLDLSELWWRRQEIFDLEIIPIDPYPYPCSSPFSPYTSEIEIVEPANATVVRRINDSEARWTDDGSIAPIVADGTVRIDLEATVTRDCNDIDHIEWTVDPTASFCPNTVRTVGTGTTATADLMVCDCQYSGSARWRIVAEAFDSNGTSISKDVHMVIFDYC